MTGTDSETPHVLATSASTGEVTLVIPGRNCSTTLDRCLQSVVPLKQSGELKEIIFVDDGSTDTTPEIAASYPVRVITGAGQGPGAARNLGWRAVDSDWVWFIDSDCVAHPDALQKLLPHISDPEVAGVGGSYSNLFPESLLATLIHEEIVARHQRMPREVDFLATFNVVYRRSVLEETQGFNESLKLAQDAELAFRISEARYQLRFDIDSKVGHHHPKNPLRYLRTQARQGYYRMALYRHHPSKIGGDSYSGLIDYAQPPLAMLLLASFPMLAGVFIGADRLTVVPLLLLGALVLLQLPLTFRMLANPSHQLRSLCFPLLSVVRSIARGLGMTAGIFAKDTTRSGCVMAQEDSAAENTGSPRPKVVS